MKDISVCKSNGKVRVEVSIFVEDNRKSRLWISNERAEQKFTRVLDKVKKFSKFSNLSLSYDEQDYYDNEVDVYTTPYIHFTKGKGKRKPTVSEQTHGCIPKEWNESFTLELVDPKTIKPVEVFLANFNIKLNAKQIKEVRKAMKGDSSFYTEIN